MTTALRTMTDNERKLFMIFKDAVTAERDAQTKYEAAIQLCEDPQLKSVLKSFCDDEARHEKEIMARYQHFRKNYLTDDGP